MMFNQCLTAMSAWPNASFARITPPGPSLQAGAGTVFREAV